MCRLPRFERAQSLNDLSLIIFISRPSWVGHMGVAVSLFNYPVQSLFKILEVSSIVKSPRCTSPLLTSTRSATWRNLQFSPSGTEKTGRESISPSCTRSTPSLDFIYEQFLPNTDLWSDSCTRANWCTISLSQFSS